MAATRPKSASPTGKSRPVQATLRKSPGARIDRSRVGQPRVDSSRVPDDRFFRQLVASMRNGVIAISRDGSLALMNDDAYRIFGLKRHLADVGQPYAEVFRARPQLVRVLSGAFEFASLPNRAELRLTELDRVVGYTMSRVTAEDGVVIGAVLFFTDLTLVEQQAERERLRDRLASLGEMAAGIAHELKNPLAGIEVMAGLLRRQVPDSPDAQGLVADILSEAKLANAIVCEMLEFVRPVRLQVEQTDLAQVVQQSITNADAKAPKGNVVVRVDIAEDVPLIESDSNQLCQVFTNLLTNAFEAANGRGTVSIRAMREPADLRTPARTSPVLDAAAADVVVVDVIDDGPGVPAELSDRIFNPFFTTKITGSGLGLPIVRKIVDAHDGRLDLYSAPGHGTRFRVSLPVTSKASCFK